MKIKAIRPASKQDTPSFYQEGSDKLLKSYASPGTEIDVVWPEAGPNVGPVLGHFSEARTKAIAPFVVQEAIKAEKEGSDAILMTGEYNVGAEVTRHMVNIPVVDTGTAGLHVAALIGDRICVLIIEDSANSYARKLFKRFGMSDFITSIKSWNIPIHEAWERKAEVKDKTVNLCKIAVEEEDAQVVLPFCGVFVPMIVPSEEIEAEVGVPVVNDLAVAVKMTEMFVNLGVHTSRKAYPYVEVGS